MKKRVLSLALMLVLTVSLLPGMKVQAAGSATGQQIVDCAMQYIGKVPYVWGGKTIDGSNPGADCSGFICRIYEKFGFNFWPNRTKLRNCGTNLGTDLSVAQLGDIIWFEGHVAIYAGKSGSNHMIVHETGGSYKNVVYTKVGVVNAELKGIIRIPGVTNNGGTAILPPTKPSVTMTTTTDSTYKAKEKITDTNAVVVNKIVKPSGVKVTKMGVILYDASGNQIKKYTEKVSNVSSSTTSYHSWYDINAELGVTLTPGTTYKYQFFGVFDGYEIASTKIYSFKTTGTAPAKICIITFWLDESGSSVCTKVLTQGEMYGGLPIAPTKTGYTFDGWYTAQTGGTKITNSTIFNGTSDITLYPRYIRNAPEKVTIYYYVDGELSIMQTSEIGDTYSNDHVEKEGYTFKGWYSSATGGSRYNGAVITATSPRVLYGRYEMNAPVFKDVFSTDYYAASVTWAVKKGITNGTSSTTFSPHKICTQAEILTFLWRAAGSPEPKSTGSVSGGNTAEYFSKAVLWATENGMLQGSTFYPNTPCTRAMAVEFMWKYAGSPSAANSNFTDVASNASYAKAVGWAVAKGITNGTSANTFSPNVICTRSQIVTLLYRSQNG